MTSASLRDGQSTVLPAAATGVNASFGDGEWCEGLLITPQGHTHWFLGCSRTLKHFVAYKHLRYLGGSTGRPKM